jgi:hypothetical protein
VDKSAISGLGVGATYPSLEAYTGVRWWYVYQEDGEEAGRQALRVRPLDIGAYATAWDRCTPERWRGRRTL